MESFNKTQNALHFEQLNQKYVSLCEKYKGSFEKLNEEVSAKAYRYEYSVGGLSLHRGFYSPSSLDLTVKGLSRGRLLKKQPKSGKFDYEYAFDDQNRLICVKCMGYKSSAKIEFLLYENNRVLSFVYDLGNDFNRLSLISECQYNNNKLIRYESALCIPSETKYKCAEINVEETNYENGLMKSVLWSSFSPRMKLLSQIFYVFERDESGCLATYTSEELTNPNSIYRGLVSVEVLKRRK